MQHQFGRTEAAKVLGIPARTLRRWEQDQLVIPSLKTGNRVFYDFPDMICLKVAQGLTEADVGAGQMMSSLRTLKKRLPSFEGQLSTKRIWIFEKRVIIGDRRRLIDTHSRNLLFKLDLESFRNQLERRLAKMESRTAQEWYREGLRLEGKPESWKQAVRCFQQAVKLDPSFGDAYSRMGFLYQAQGQFIDAQRCFRIALRRNPYDFETCFQLGNVLDELNCTEEALRWYEKAVEIQPEYSSAYFNLATAAERLGLLDRAVRAWRAFLQAAPQSPKAAVVRRRIQELEQHLAGQV